MELSAQTYRDLSSFIHKECGIALGPEKAYLVRHRLEPLVSSEGLDGFDMLLQRVQAHPSGRLRNALIDAITVKETRFFRDQAFFESLQRHILPECAAGFAQTGGRQRIRIWSAASSTGQEAYSVAMLVRELAEQSPENKMREGQFSILASDVSTEAIEAAKSGSYSRADVDRGLSDDRLQRHFRHRGSRWCVDESLRRLVHCRTFNLLDSAADLGPFDLILCRNVMIYFDEPTRRKICRGMYAILHPGGYLALGSAESLYGMADKFETLVIGKTVLYRKPQRG